MAILTKAGRAVIAAAIKAKPLHLAWGIGDGSWMTTPAPEDVDATGLISELGRRICDVVEYVVPDNAGAIEIVGAGKFSITSTPTNKLYVEARFDFADEPTAYIREIAVFVDTVVQSGLPGGQRYFTPSQITNPGKLLQLEHKQAIPRTAGTKESFSTLLVF